MCCMPISVHAHACAYGSWSSTLGVILSLSTLLPWDRVSQLSRSSLFLADRQVLRATWLHSPMLSSGTHSQAQPFTWVMRILTQVLTLTEQALSPTSPSTLPSVLLSHLLSLCEMTFYSVSFQLLWICHCEQCANGYKTQLFFLWDLYLNMSSLAYIVILYLIS